VTLSVMLKSVRTSALVFFTGGFADVASVAVSARGRFTAAPDVATGFALGSTGFLGFGFLLRVFAIASRKMSGKDIC